MRYVVILTLAISLAAGAVIRDLAVEAEGVNTKLIITADAPFVATSYTLKNPPRIVVDCSGVTSDLTGKRYAVHKGGVQEQEAPPYLLNLLISMTSYRTPKNLTVSCTCSVFTISSRSSYTFFKSVGVTSLPPNP